jgi:hypothetical protein
MKPHPIQPSEIEAEATRLFERLGLDNDEKRAALLTRLLAGNQEQSPGAQYLIKFTNHAEPLEEGT